jgi:hypothetical protein
LVEWALRPCNRCRRDKGNIKCRVSYLLVGWALRPCNWVKRDKLYRKGRVGYF